MGLEVGVCHRDSLSFIANILRARGWAKCFMYMISFNSYINPVLSILFIFILILEMRIKRLFINVKSWHDNLDILKILMVQNPWNFWVKYWQRNRRGRGRRNIPLVHLCFETAGLVLSMYGKISLVGCDQHLKNAVEWDGTGKKMSEWTVDGKGKYCSMNVSFLWVLVYNVNVYLSVSHS